MEKLKKMYIKRRMINLLQNRRRVLYIVVGRLLRPSIQRAERTKDADKLRRKVRSGAEGGVGPGARNGNKGVEPT